MRAYVRGGLAQHRARLLFVARGYLAAVETGEATPGPELVVRMCSVYGVPGFADADGGIAPKGRP
jgi:transcriptional regulator with XRE-family HTH domain